MKVRAVANGNIIDLPEGHGLIAAGIYVPVEASEAVPPAEPVAQRVEAPPAAKPSPTKVAPMGTKSMQSPASKRSTPKRRK